MRLILVAIALLAIIGCTGAKPAVALPTCKEFYEVHADLARELGAEPDSIYAALANVTEWRECKCKCRSNIDCDGKSYCVDPMMNSPKCTEFYRINEDAYKDLGMGFDELNEEFDISSLPKDQTCVESIACDGHTYCIRWQNLQH